MDLSGNVDFDFFDTPRNDNNESTSYAQSDRSTKPPRAKRVEKNDQEHADKDGGKVNRNQGKTAYDSYSSDESLDSDSDSETPRIQRAPAKVEMHKVPKPIASREKGQMSPESSSAYSDSESYSDESDENEKRNDGSKTNIMVKLPKTEAWGEKRETKQSKNRLEKKSKYSSEPREPKDAKRSPTKAVSDSDSDSSQEHYKHNRKQSSRRLGSMTQNGKEKSDKQARQPLKSTSSSHSNNSDITDVSPLESPDVSPRETRKRYNVQYKNRIPSEPDADIRMDSDKIDLSILMKCMADIDREKQQRIKANSRRVMFAPPSQQEKAKSNYTFSSNRARMIEKENQRLLQQIMQHVQPGSKKLKPGTATKPIPKKATEPVIQRLTPSAVNRQRQQQKIEMENLQMLRRLQTVKASRGMSRQEQLTEFDRHAAYGMPTYIMPTGTGDFDKSMPYRETHSQMSGTTSVGQTQRSRPSSAKSNQSTGSRRSRPSSAKSNASIRSNASLRSNISIRSGTSTRSQRDKDVRPPWDDRFSYS